MKKARLVAAAVASLTLTAGAAARPHARADLVESGLGAAPAQLAPGASFALAYTVANRGGAIAPRSLARYYLRDGRTSLLTGVVRVPSLRSGHKARGSARLTVPATAVEASYSLVACVDAARSVKETNERNNCRTARGHVDIRATLAATPPPTSTPPPPPPPGVADTDHDGTADGADCAPRDRSIHPGAADEPDLAFVDSNCDGIDGDATKSIFVARTGSDTNPGSHARPMRTVSAAVAKAGPDELAVLVAAGSYDEGTGVELRDGVGIFGGYVPGSWSRSRSTATLIVGSPQAALADGDTRITLQLLTLRGKVGPLSGESTYAVRALNHSTLSLEGSKLVTDDGRPGAKGADGTTGADGQPGADGRHTGDSNVGPGGAGGASPVPGGRGGNGGPEADHDGQPGATGTGASGGAGGAEGEGGRNPTNGQTGAPGRDGLFVGFPGIAGTSAADLAGAVWRGHDGGAGGSGNSGSGGGGGGGGGGLVAGFLRFDLPGGGGGGGGAGGAGGGGGRGGQAGGGSFGVYLVDSAVTLSGTTVAVGAGGPGGAGGAGGAGGHGGAGGVALRPPDDVEDRAADGGPGARGGDGASGGIGGGGAGGPSIGIFENGDSKAVVGSGATITAGLAGHGGGSAQDGIAARIFPAP